MLLPENFLPITKMNYNGICQNKKYLKGEEKAFIAPPPYQICDYVTQNSSIFHKKSIEHQILQYISHKNV